MIVTRRRRIPWSWAGVLAIPSAAEAMMEAVSGTALAFTALKFTQDPRAIAFLGSLNLAFNFLIAPLAAWQSDRRWSRRGRRTPLMLIGGLTAALALLAAPAASGLAALAAVVVVYQAAVDAGFTGPWTPLFFEIVPPAQRGRAVVIRRAGMIAAQLLFNLALIGQFDRRYVWGSWQVTGEQVLYGTAAALTLGALLVVGLGIRERRPAGATTTERPFRDIWSLHNQRSLALLAFSAVAMTVCLGPLQPVMITEQFGYSKEMLGKMAAVAMAAEVAVALPAMAWLSDRPCRMRLYQILLALAAALPMGFWGYIRFAAPGQTPAPAAIAAFMVAHSLTRTMALLCVEPLFFEGVASNDMGKTQAAVLVARGVLSMAVVNGVGWWVDGYSRLFGSGDSMRIDYASGYLYMGGVAVLALVASIVYAAHLGNGAATQPGAGAMTRPAMTRPGMMGGACCHMK